MNSTNLLQKLAPVGVAAFGAIAFNGIAIAPVKAAVIGSAGFDTDATFVEAPDLSSVTLSDFENFADGEYTGIFAGSLTGDTNPPFQDGPCPTPGGITCLPSTYEIVSMEDITLNRVGTSDLYANDFIDDFKVYENDAGETITFDLAAGALWTRAVTSTGVIEYVNIGDSSVGYEGTYSSSNSTIQALLAPGINGSGVMNFSNDGITDVADIEITQSAVGEKVPEPATIFGLLTVGGLGLRLKRKKQA